MSPQMELKQRKNERILRFIDSHSTEELLIKLEEICNDKKMKSKL